MTSNEQSLEGLIERVKVATGPDREIDWQIDNALNLHYDFFTRPRFTDSIDAALALAERMLPGCAWSVCVSDENDADGWFEAQIDGHIRQAQSAALAIGLATLTALQSSETRK